MRMKSESVLRILSPLAIAAVIAACGGDAGDTETTPPPATPPAATGASEAGLADALAYRLTMPDVQRFYEAQKGIYRAIGENPDLADEMEFFGQADDIGQLEAHFDGIPEFRAAVTAAGLDMREYAAILIALFHARAVDNVVQSGADRAQTIASRQMMEANLEFVEQNRDELNRLEGELNALGESMQ
jgi:hypothetical protein